MAIKIDINEQHQRLVTYLDGIEGTIAALTKAADQAKDQGHLALIKTFKVVDDAYEALNTAKKSLNELHDRMSRDFIPEAMREAGVKTVNVIGVGRVSLSRRYSVSMVNKALGYQWLRDNNAEALITETVNAQTLAAFAKKRVEDEGKELPEDIFKSSIMTYTSVTKA